MTIIEAHATHLRLKQLNVVSVALADISFGRFRFFLVEVNYCDDTLLTYLHTCEDANMLAQMNARRIGSESRSRDVIYGKPCCMPLTVDFRSKR